MPARSDRRPSGLRFDLIFLALGVFSIGAYLVIRTWPARPRQHAQPLGEPVRAQPAPRLAPPRPAEAPRRIEPPGPIVPGRIEARPVPPPPALQPPHVLSWAAPDQSLWSAKRIRAWEAAGSVTDAAAVLRIPKINLEVPVLEGTDDATLDRGLGHIEGTPPPGAPGNLGISGHRDGFFRGLKDIAPGDVIELETPRDVNLYVVECVMLVDPEDVWVLEPTPSPELTLVTCFPFYYVGSAPKRYIVKAALSPSAAGG